jgi:hypothetical protein
MLFSARAVILHWAIASTVCTASAMVLAICAPLVALDNRLYIYYVLTAANGPGIAFTLMVSATSTVSFFALNSKKQTNTHPDPHTLSLFFLSLSLSLSKQIESTAMRELFPDDPSSSFAFSRGFEAIAIGTLAVINYTSFYVLAGVGLAATLLSLVSDSWCPLLPGRILTVWRGVHLRFGEDLFAASQGTC